MHIENIKEGDYVIVTGDRHLDTGFDGKAVTPDPVFSGSPRKVHGISAPFVLTEWKGAPVSFDTRRFEFVIASEAYAKAFWDLENSYDEKIAASVHDDASTVNCVECGGVMTEICDTLDATGDAKTYFACDSCGAEQMLKKKKTN